MRATDTPLSPAAAAVRAAADNAQGLYWDQEDQAFESDQTEADAIAAAALRAAADAVAPVAMPHRRKIRDELFTIADELEAGR